MGRSSSAKKKGNKSSFSFLTPSGGHSLASKMTAPTTTTAAMDTTAHGTSDDPTASGNAGLGDKRGVDGCGTGGAAARTTAGTPPNNVAGKNSNQRFAACFSLASSAADSSPSGSPTASLRSASPAESTIFSAITGEAVVGGAAGTVMAGGDEMMEYNDEENEGKERKGGVNYNRNGAEGRGGMAAMQVARRITLAGDGIMESSGNNSFGAGTKCTTAIIATTNAGAARDDYVRSAARFRSLVGSALRRVADGFGTTAGSDNNKNVGGDIASVSRCKRSRTLDSRPSGGGGAEEDDESSSGSFSSPGGGGGGGSTRAIRRRKLLGGGSSGSCGLGGRDYAADLAREKAAEVLVLQRELREAKDRAVALKATNATLRDSSSSEAKRVERMSEALRIASANAANARADADAAEARATALATQISQLRTIVNETKRQADTVRGQHDEISAATRTVEARLVEAETALSRAERDRNRAEDERDDLVEKQEEANLTIRSLRDDLDKSRKDVLLLKKASAERDAVEHGRMERTNRVEAELRDAKTMLLEATSAAAETESTTGVLNETIAELQKENKTLHETIRGQLDDAAKERSKLGDALSRSEGEAQRLRLKAATDEEEIQRLRLDKTQIEREKGQLSTKIGDLQQRLTEATTGTASLGVLSSGKYSSLSSSLPSLPGTSSTSSIGSTRADAGKAGSAGAGGDTSSCGGGSSAGGFVIPPLRGSSSSSTNSSTNKEKNRSGSSNTSSKRSGGSSGIGGRGLTDPLGNVTGCSICNRDAYGMMKACPCGGVCGLRAHARCLQTHDSTFLCEE